MPGDGAADGPIARALMEPDDGPTKTGASSPAARSVEGMPATIEQQPGSQTTRMLLERIIGGTQGAKLRSQVAAWHRGATREQVEEAFQEACARAHRACHGQTEGEVFTWLRTTTHRHLGRMQDRARREILGEVPDSAFDEAHRSPPSPEQQLIDRENRAEIERMTRAVLTGLSDRQSQIAALHGHGMRRPQIAAQLGMTERSVKRALERILAVGRREIVRLAGHGCKSGESLVARCAFGLASTEEVRQARDHLTGCARCALLYERLELLREKVAVLLPIPATAHADGFVDRWLHPATDALSNVKRHVTDGAVAVKQHVSGGYDYPAIDPIALASIRPGAVAATFAGCLALGGGATYCVQEGVGPIAALGVTTATDRHEKHRRVQRAPAARATTPPVVAATVPTPTRKTAPPVPQPVVQPTATTPQMRPAPAAVAEFDPDGGGGGGAEHAAPSTEQAARSTEQAAPTTEQAAPSTEPAAPRSESGSEFDGP